MMGLLRCWYYMDKAFPISRWSSKEAWKNSSQMMILHFDTGWHGLQISFAFLIGEWAAIWRDHGCAALNQYECHFTDLRHNLLLILWLLHLGLGILCSLVCHKDSRFGRCVIIYNTSGFWLFFWCEKYAVWYSCGNVWKTVSSYVRAVHRRYGYHNICPNVGHYEHMRTWKADWELFDQIWWGCSVFGHLT